MTKITLEIESSKLSHAQDLALRIFLALDPKGNKKELANLLLQFDRIIPTLKAELMEEAEKK
jgi:hypothetical protein